MSRPDPIDSVIDIELEDEPSCFMCHCTAEDGCIDGTGVVCHWHSLYPPLCSSCVGIGAAVMLAGQRDEAGQQTPAFYPLTPLAFELQEV